MPGAKIDAVQIISQRLLTLPEAAHYLGCTLWSVRELMWKGQLSFTRFGARLMRANNRIFEVGLFDVRFKETLRSHTYTKSSS